MTNAALSHLMIGLPGSTIPDYLSDLAARGLRSVCIYGENVESHEQLRDYVAELRAILGPKTIIAIDEEGGEVTRIDYKTGSRFAGNGYLGQLDDVELTRRDGRLIASMLAHYGVNLNLAPVADVNVEPKNPVIGIRSFGSEQGLVARHVAAFVEGHQEAGVGVTLKHFPGHGNTKSDSHHELPRVEGGLAELLDGHIQPFSEGIRAGAAALMLAHLNIGADAPTSLSAEIVDLARNQLTFDGLIITDALDMGALGPREELPENAIRALRAGVDLVCTGPRTTLSEIDRFEEIWLAMGMDSEDAAAAAIARLDNYPFFSAAADEPTGIYYPPLSEISSSSPVGQVVRISGSANLAVGQVPWYADVEVDVAIESADEIASLNLPAFTKTALLVRNAREAESAAAQISEQNRSRFILISPEPVRLPTGLEGLVTFGTALPQSQFLSSVLQKGLTSNV